MWMCFIVIDVKQKKWKKFKVILMIDFWKYSYLNSLSSLFEKQSFLNSDWMTESIPYPHEFDVETCVEQCMQSVFAVCRYTSCSTEGRIGEYYMGLEGRIWMPRRMQERVFAFSRRANCFVFDTGSISNSHRQFDAQRELCWSIMDKEKWEQINIMDIVFNNFWAMFCCSNCCSIVPTEMNLLFFIKLISPFFKIGFSFPLRNSLG